MQAMFVINISIVMQDSTTVAELQQIMKSTDHNGFPVVVSRFGFIAYTRI